MNEDLECRVLDYVWARLLFDISLMLILVGWTPGYLVAVGTLGFAAYGWARTWYDHGEILRGIYPVPLSRFDPLPNPVLDVAVLGFALLLLILFLLGGVPLRPLVWTGLLSVAVFHLLSVLKYTTTYLD